MKRSRKLTLADVRRELEAARTADEAAGNHAVAVRLDQVLSELGGELLLTTTEAARQLGIRSVNTVRAAVDQPARLGQGPPRSR